MKSITKLCFALSLGVLLFSYSCSDYIGVQPPKDPPKMLLTYPELVQMLRHYDDTRKAQFGAIIQKDEDTRINNFTLTEIKEYIAYIEKECKDKKIPLDGINFISASYPENYVQDPIRSKYQTIIMMPATEVAGEKMVSFDPFLSGERDPMPLKDILKKYNYTTWAYDTLANRANSRQKMMQSRSSTDIGTGLSPGGNRAGISPPM
jgi:hypothetical protein